MGQDAVQEVTGQGAAPRPAAGQADAVAAKLLGDLNDQQRAAVSAPRGNLLIIAGAGTGKTTVLTRRVGWLVEHEGVPPWKMLAITFTNRAAAQMSFRIASLGLPGGPDYSRMWIGTFHAVCMRLLHIYCAEAGLTENFTVLDTEARRQVVKRLLVELDIPHTNGLLRDYLSGIGRLKEMGLRAGSCTEEHYSNLGFSAQMRFDEVYSSYELTCLRENLVDFDEMLLRSCELLERYPEVRTHLHWRFAEILADEFQDTSALQYRFVRLLAGPDSHTLIVGDDDQSIYSWRGSDFHNMERFRRDFPGVQEFHLEQNYRSGQIILDLANLLIRQSPARLSDKQLQGKRGPGTQVHVTKCRDPSYEAAYIVQQMRTRHQAGVSYGQMAVLYRFNYQSAPLEQELMRRGVPFRVYGGFKFYDRQEIQDAVAYLRVVLNAQDDSAFLRILNVPPRRLGAAVRARLISYAQRHAQPLQVALETLCADKAPKGDDARLKKQLRVFGALLADLQKARAQMSLPDFITYMLKESGLKDFYERADERREHLEGDDSRKAANLEELVNQAQAFILRADLPDDLPEAPSSGASGAEDGDEKSEDTAPAPVPENLHSGDPLFEFVARALLAASTELDAKGRRAEEHEGVTIMTMHASKGLEYGVVFIAGFEEGLIPDWRDEDVDEERRLAYVAVTRARDELYISACDGRMVYGEDLRTGVSSFLHQAAQQCRESHQKLPFVVERLIMKS